MFRISGFVTLVALLGAPPLGGAATDVYFNQSVDLRYAWLDNDAQGEADFLTLVTNHIASATTSIDVASMTFSSEDVANALAAAAASGIDVRIIGDGARRNQVGYLLAQAGGCAVADNNLPALVYRVNFQDDAGAGPAGWLIDRGQTYGPHDDGVSYGWASSQAAYMHSGGVYDSLLLDECYARSNSSGTQTWSIAVPSGFYYVLAVVGESDYNSKNFVTCEGQEIFLYSHSWTEWLGCGAGEFDGSPVCGGYDSDNGHYEAQRIHVTDGQLTLSVGKSGESSYSSLAYVEIYRADPSDAQGDWFTDTDEVQKQTTHHSKFILVDGGTASAKIWVGSGNLTSGMTTMAEDQILTDDADVCDAFYDHFNQMWGSSGLEPDPSASAFNRFKDPALSAVDCSVDGYDWLVRFSPSVGAHDMYQTVEDFLAPAQHNLILNLEQFTDSGGLFGYDGPEDIMDNVIPPLLSLSGFELYGVLGGDLSDAIFSVYSAYANVHLAHSDFSDPDPTMHNKVAIVDALDDSRYTLNGSVLCGSMNWSQSGMLCNDEQTLVIDNPYIANQYLQQAMARLAEKGIEPDRHTDIVVAVDRSNSMNLLCNDGVTTKIDAATMAADLFIDLIEPDEGHRMSVVRFGKFVEPFVPDVVLDELTTLNLSDYHDAVDDIVTGGDCGTATCYGLALEECEDQLTSEPNPNPRQIVHFFTDGNENLAPWADEVYPGMVTDGIEIHSTGFGADITPDVLEEMAEASGGTFAQVALDTTSLSKRFVEVARAAMDLETLLDPSYIVSREQMPSTTISVDRTCRKLKFILMWGTRKPYLAQMTVVSPNKVQLKKGLKGVRQVDGDGYTIWHVDLDVCPYLQAEGTWRITMAPGLEFPGKTAEVELVVLGDGDIDYRAEVVPAATRKNPTRVRLLCRMLNEGTPVRTVKSAAVTWTGPLDREGQDPAPVKVALYDDGKHGDGKANDGLFGRYLILTTAGCNTFHFVTQAQVPGKMFRTVYPRREAVVTYTLRK